MRKALKPFLGPIILFLIKPGFTVFPVININQFWTGIIYGLAGFWLILALFSNKAFVKRFPTALEWMPFLDPSGGFASAEQLTGKFIQGQTFNISLIAHEGTIRDRTFTDCDIHGPAVLITTGVGHTHNCTFYGPQDAIFIQANQERVIGPIYLIDCSFRNCRFHKIGIIGNEAAINKWRSGTKSLER